jgi:hypothetical protein
MTKVNDLLIGVGCSVLTLVVFFCWLHSRMYPYLVRPPITVERQGVNPTQTNQISNITNNRINDGDISV